MNLGKWFQSFKAGREKTESPVKRSASATGYEAASMGRRLSTWAPGNAGVNFLIHQNAEILRARSRDLVRRNAWASNGVEGLVANLVGTGIRPRSTHPNPDFVEQVQALWNQWVTEADANGILDIYGLQALAVRSMVEGGDVFVRFRNRLPVDGLSVPLQLQLLEAEHLPTFLNQSLPNGNSIRSGIEFDKIGRRAAYHMYREHPGEMTQFGGGYSILIPMPIPASEIIHLFRQLRPGQNRGEPWLTQALVKLYDLDQYDDAELVRKKTAALIAGFITKPSPDSDLGAIDNYTPSADGGVSAVWTPGTLQVLLPGEGIEFSAPADVGANYEPFMRLQLRAAAASIGITYEQMTGDLTGVNFSSIRAGLIEIRRRMQQWQQTIIIQQFCRPIFNRWMDQAVLSGALIAPGYAKRFREYQAVRWIAHGWDWVDPLKDIEATIMMIRSGLISRDQAVAALGFNAEDIDHALAEEQARADRLGLMLDVDGRRPLKGSSNTVSPKNDQGQP